MMDGPGVWVTLFKHVNNVTCSLALSALFSLDFMSTMIRSDPNLTAGPPEVLHPLQARVDLATQSKKRAELIQDPAFHSAKVKSPAGLSKVFNCLISTSLK